MEKTTIDTAGRVVIPKALRDELGFTPGSELLVYAEDGNLVIEPVPMELELKRNKNGTMYAVSKKKVPMMSEDLVRDVLERVRDRK
ncbi:MAG TPA: AbrB/MazE/SpoVT family DNA-binding domain-containing protein [Kofleriaceae bacterium]|jgi:AbrB family looped-hinge helix DNA binding protein